MGFLVVATFLLLFQCVLVAGDPSSALRWVCFFVTLCSWLVLAVIWAYESDLRKRL